VKTLKVVRYSSLMQRKHGLFLLFGLFKDCLEISMSSRESWRREREALKSCEDMIISHPNRKRNTLSPFVTQISSSSSMELARS